MLCNIDFDVNKLLIVPFFKLISLLENLISSIRKEHKQFSPLWYLSHVLLLIALFESELLLGDDSVVIGDLRQPVLTLVLLKVPQTVTHSLAEDVCFESRLLLFLHTKYSSYSLSIKASNSLRFGVTFMLTRGIPSLAAICASSTVSYSKVINSSSSPFIKSIMFLSKFSENIDDEFKIALLSLLINIKYDKRIRHLPRLCQSLVKSISSRT